MNTYTPQPSDWPRRLSAGAGPCRAAQRTLPRMLLAALSGWLLVTSAVTALEVVGMIERVDAEGAVLQIRANRQSRTLAIAKDVRVHGDDGEPLAPGLKAEQLKPGAMVTISVDRQGGHPVVRAIRLGGRPRDADRPQGDGSLSVGLKPFNEMTAEDRYKGEDGGLYGGGRNGPPEAHLAAARAQATRIIPLAADGSPAVDGIIGLVSISMSNATQEFSLFKQMADRDPRKSPALAIVDCAQGGQAMAEWVDPQARAWQEADRRLAQAKVSPLQVQAVWVKLANKGPRGELAEHGGKLKRDTVAVVQNAKARFPNLRVAYLGSRIYAGYATTALNPEPYAYESAFVVRWLIRSQVAGDPELLFDEAHGAAKAPLLLWGPYFWADGTMPRAGDGLTWNRADFAGDGTHPSPSGRRKVADMLLKFFTEDALAAPWFVRKAQ